MKTLHNNKVATLAVAMLSVAFFASSAHADDKNGLTVHYSDLNLNTTAGAKVLYQRIQGAAKQVCGDVDAKQMELAAAAKTCLVQAIGNSVRTVNAAKLTRVANEHGYGASTGLSVASAR